MKSSQSFSFMKLSRLKVFRSSNRSKRVFKLYVHGLAKEKDWSNALYKNLSHFYGRKKKEIEDESESFINSSYFPLKILEGHLKLLTEVTFDFDTLGGKNLVCHTLKVSSSALEWVMNYKQFLRVVKIFLFNIKVFFVF